MLDNNDKMMIEDCFKLIKEQERLIETLYRANKELRHTNTWLKLDNDSQANYDSLKLKYDVLRDVQINTSTTLRLKDKEISELKQKINQYESELSEMKFRIQNTYKELKC